MNEKLGITWPSPTRNASLRDTIEPRRAGFHRPRLAKVTLRNVILMPDTSFT